MILRSETQNFMMGRYLAKYEITPEQQVSQEDETHLNKLPAIDRLTKTKGVEFVKDLKRLKNNKSFTLQEMGDKYGLSRERIRQLFNKVYKKSVRDARENKPKKIKEVSVKLKEGESMNQTKLKDECFEDMSVGNSVVGKGIPKEERYSWNNANAGYGIFKLIDKADLRIDKRYQREAVSKKKILNIVRDFDWRLFGTISVIQRNDGKFYIYDGGHRWRGSMYRNSITALPCMVFKLDNLSEEASVFYKKNTLKSGMSPYQRFKALVVAEDTLALKTKEMLDSCGYSPAATQGTPLDFRPIGTFLKMVNTNENAALQTLELCAAIADEKDNIQVDTLRGVFYLIRNLSENICVGKNRSKLISFGIRAIEASIKREKIIVGKGGERVEAKAILDMINNRSPKKIPFPS